MPTIAADFGIVLAYIIPGFFCLWAATLLSDGLAGLFSQAHEGEKRALSIFALIALSLVVGMFISILRAVTIDQSFKVVVPLCNRAQYLWCDSVDREDPTIAALSCEGPREAFLLFESRDKRPYQFYGNMVLAVSIVAGTGLAGMLKGKNKSKRSWPKIVAGVALWAVLAATFYVGSRTAHYRFMNSVKVLNTLKCSGDGKRAT